MATIGQKLGEARRKAGMSVEDVAHETHIHANMIDRIEEDDFSKFASVAYARSFIRNYAEFLEVDLGTSMEALDSSKTLRLGEHELMGEMKKTIKKDRRFRLQRNPRSRRRMDKPGGAPIFLNVVLFALIAAITVFYFLGYKASSPQQARDEIARGLQKANPFDEGSDNAETAQVVEEEPIPEDQSGSKDKKEEKPAPTLRPATLPGENQGTQQVNAETNESTPETVSPGLGIPKPEVDWSIEERKPSPLARLGNGKPEALKSVETPELEIESEEVPVKPIQSAELPEVNQAVEEPAAALRPNGTDPVPGNG